MIYHPLHTVILQQANGGFKQVLLSDMQAGYSLDYKKELKKEKSTYVYAISNGRHIKIGKSDDPINRMYDMQTSNSETLSLICSYKCMNQKLGFDTEKSLHNIFHDKKARGEWFDITEQELQKEWNELNNV